MNALIPPANPSYQRSRSILSASVGEEMLMMSVEMGQYYNLNAVAGRIWHLLETPQNLDQITLALAQTYDAQEATIRAEVGAFLARLEREGLLEIVPPQT